MTGSCKSNNEPLGFHEKQTCQQAVSTELIVITVVTEMRRSYQIHCMYICSSVVMVVGAGRGPLVRAALNAAQKADRKIRIYAVEKNPNAVVT